jgi:hypothetical protein
MPPNLNYATDAFSMAGWSTSTVDDEATDEADDIICIELAAADDIIAEDCLRPIVEKPK